MSTGGAGEQQQRQIWKKPCRSGTELAEIAGVAGPRGLAATRSATSMYMQKSRYFATPSTPAPTLIPNTRARRLSLRIHLLGNPFAFLLCPKQSLVNIIF